MIFNWFDASEAVEFAREIGGQYGRLRKSSALRMDDGPKRAKKLEKLVEEVNDFKRNKRPNIYKKARMMREIGNALREQDIPEPEIEIFVNSLVFNDLPRR